jgi:hypothetical protein
MRILSIAAALSAVALACAAPAQAQQNAFPTLRIGQRVSGQLQAGDPALFQGGRFKVYSFQAQAGRRYVATMESGEFDAFLTVARSVGGITDHMMMDDDGGGETNSRLRFMVPATGTYLLIARSLAEDGTGAFTVGLDTLRAPRLTIADVRPGQTVQGEITENDLEFPEGEASVAGFYDVYRLRGTPGQRVRIRMTMGEYFPVLSAGAMDGDEFVPEVFSQGGNQLLLTLPESGEYLVQAGAEGNVFGPYTLTVEERGPVVVPPARPIRVGEAVTGRLDESDGESDEDGRWYDLYAYTGRAGERVRITMASDEFDTVVSLGRMVNGAFQEIATNDDEEGGEGTHSAVELELPEAGSYVIMATSFSAGSTGGYQLRVAAP